MRAYRKDTVRWESPPVAPDLLIELLGRYAIDRGQIDVEHDPLAAYEQDAMGYLQGGWLGFHTYNTVEPPKSCGAWRPREEIRA